MFYLCMYVNQIFNNVDAEFLLEKCKHLVKKPQKCLDELFFLIVSKCVKLMF